MRLLPIFLLSLLGCVNSHPVTTTTPDECSDEYDDPARHEWQTVRFPRKIVVDPTLPIETAESAFVAADRWNQEMDADLFDITVTTQKHDDIEVIQMQEWSTRRGSTWWNSGHAVVAIREDFIGVPDIDWLFVHEFGHALNLAHEPNDPDSWMHTPTGPHISAHSRCMVNHALEEWRRNQ